MYFFLMQRYCFYHGIAIKKAFKLIILNAFLTYVKVPIRLPSPNRVWPLRAVQWSPACSRPPR